MSSFFRRDHIGYNLTKDPKVEWPGSDVAWNNYKAALETLEVGPYYLINTWNQRANPYSDKSILKETKKTARELIEKYNMNFLIGDRWDKKNIDLEVDIRNNRAYMHPPLAPIILSLWFSIFPNSHWSANIFMILINIFVFILLYNKLKNSVKDEYLILPQLILLTSIVFIIFNTPSAEHITMLFLTISALFFLNTKIWSYFLSGVFLCLAFYTKFIAGFIIGFLFVLMILKIKEIGWKNVLSFLSGVLIVFIIFISMGYYFWLTAIVGAVYTKAYIADTPRTFLSKVSKLLYYGPSLILIFVLTILEFFSKKYDVKSIILNVSIVFSIILFSALTWKLGTLNRYLFIFFPSLFIGANGLFNRINLPNKDIMIIPITNFLFLLLITYF